MIEVVVKGSFTSLQYPKRRSFSTKIRLNEDWIQQTLAQRKCKWNSKWIRQIRSFVNIIWIHISMYFLLVRLFVYYNNSPLVGAYLFYCKRQDLCSYGTNFISILIWKSWCFSHTGTKIFSIKLSSRKYLWFFAQFRNICKISKTWKTPMEECYF